MRIKVYDTPQRAARALAAYLSRAIARTPDLVLGLPTGRTPIPLYRELAALGERHDIDFSRVTTFNLDEFRGKGAADPGSYRAFMQGHLFRHVNLTARNIHFLNGRAEDVRVECERYERAIARAGGIDLQILGLGANGHIGFNEPGRRLIARTHCARLTAPTRAANAALFGGDVRKVPRQALSMGMVTILHARRIVMLATGIGKARCVARMVNGPLTTELPASFLQVHRQLDVLLDRAAAEYLERGDENPRRSGARH
ncbi:MAG TPA: glucosamine-6-phosphate deaminase [Vicinamibacterales bacterium]|jgi:glucosamine-6-phosphate deaminase